MKWPEIMSYLNEDQLTISLETTLLRRALVFKNSVSVEMTARNQMRIRRVLYPLIRLCQCSGLCPLSVYGPNEYSTIEATKIHFFGLTAVIFAVQVLMCVLSYMNSAYFVDWTDSNITNYITVLVSLTIRVHACTVLIESIANRSIQFQLLKKFDEIDDVFVSSLKTETSTRHLERRCGRLVHYWVVKISLFVSMVLLCGILTSQWEIIYILALVIPPLYTSTLFYTQLSVFLYVTQYNVRMINEHLEKLSDAPEMHWRRPHRQRISALETTEMCKKLTHLRICYCKTWQASMLINRYVRWSLLLGITNDFVFYVSNLYWILVFVIAGSSQTWALLVSYVLWAILNASHFVRISTLCDGIMRQVRTYFAEKWYSN